jgi:hypothetical protein
MGAERKSAFLSVFQQDSSQPQRTPVMAKAAVCGATPTNRHFSASSLEEEKKHHG